MARNSARIVAAFIASSVSATYFALGTTVATGKRRLMSKSCVKVAIIDDDPSVRSAMSRLLTNASFETKTYGSAREFIETAADEAPDCLIVDFQMPKFTGLDLLRYLLRHKMTIPTIIITALDDPTIEQNCVRLGAKAVLKKPLRGAVLVDSIRAAIGK